MIEQNVFQNFSSIGAAAKYEDFRH
jgi:hypothetical protein